MPERLRVAYIQLKQQLGDIKLLAVTKRQRIEKIRALYDLGQRLFAENYVQEGIEKIRQLQLPDAQWHFIGQIQSNKTKVIAAHFDWVQSIDRFDIAERLQKHCELLDKTIQVCINVNIDNEPQKGGVTARDAFTLAKKMQLLTRLKLRGIMAIPKPCKDYSKQLDTFKKIKQLFDELNDQGFALDTLSIGMSADYKAAIAAGSTMIRIGTSLFGAREE